ncbi:hypothetical protein SODALDRAFT_392255 [Sodiomyces alkalinus F11]|uniref:BRCT domain-containing protein n=1 Tax=Sodiomyces alkalinus (strain CBS 110278 / VKM F-3762 / F11) TaxID=1314773 RepID=A0A3N2Q7T8_SODAK|nr:hypothetical protein SODALDRAFT_392255 [Sodiomyces alkalinus F11]ROT42841.1 hypothetical protein SODALDRAFT_392255 [Sodiomyces alkalinus F11]
MVRGIFKNLVIATAAPMPDQFTDENLNSWITQRKGRFTKDLDDSVTHLLCTTEQYKSRNKIPRMKEALLRKKLRIVHLDWLDFSCNRNRKLPEKDFNFQALRDEEKAQKRLLMAKTKAKKNLAMGERWINPDLYTTFVDKYNFEYKAELARTTQDEFGTDHEKYVLHLFQSNAKPRLYWFAAKMYKKTEGKCWREAGIHRPRDCSGSFKSELASFKAFFKLKTGIDWCDRIWKAGTRVDGYHFQYRPPTGGKPVGGSLANGWTVEECWVQNRELRLLYQELFGDEYDESLDQNGGQGPSGHDGQSGSNTTSHWPDQQWC